MPATRALEAKARENAPSAYVTNPMPEKTGSPERSLIKGAAHKRMQSMQNPNVRDLRSYLDSTRTPDRSPERPKSSRAETPSFSKEDKESIFDSPRMNTPTPSARDILRDTPTLRPTSRSQHKALLGENTPPSATMLALQSMPLRDMEPPPLANITNSSSPRAAQPAGEGISAQIREIANLCAGLQKEMAQLSRRSKDNASDLIGLKEATNSRDEDIRKSLKELVNNFHGTNFLGPIPPGLHTRSGSFGGSQTPPAMGKSFSLPHLSSPTSYLDERIGSPNPYSVEGAASVAMLEKIIREMVTKEGQERLVNTLNSLFDKANHDSSETVKKVGELVEFIKQGSNSQALIQHGGGGNGDGTAHTEAGAQNPDVGPVARATRDINNAFGLSNDANSSKPFSSPKAADFVSADMLKLLKKIKDSVTESGGVTAEVKALLRDLRGEVLGMGRELGRKIDEVTPNSSGALAIEDGQNKEDIGRIIRDGLAELQEHMDQVLRENRRQSSGSIVSRASVDSHEVHQVVKHAMAERGIDSGSVAPSYAAPLDKEAILSAVKEAYEEYKPEIELQQFGLERDEILECLRQGLEDYRASAPRSESGGVSREAIMDAVAEAMQHFNPPQRASESAEIREEVLGAVRECLDEFRPSMQVGPLMPDFNIARGVVLEAIREGLEAHEQNAPRELEINREDLHEAMKGALEEQRTPFSNYGEQVLNSLHELVDNMRGEFKAYSSANGRDTEQVLDAVKDGLESLRADIEIYVDRAQDVTGKDEIVHTVREGLETLRTDVQAFVAAGPQGDQALGRNEMLAYIKSEFEHLHEAMDSQMTQPSGTQDKEEILQALHEGMENLNAQIGTRGLDESSSEEMQEAMKQEFEQLREAILSGTASHRDEVLDTIHASLENLHQKLESQNSGAQSNEEVVTTMKEEFEHLRETLGATLVKSGAAADKDDIIDAVRETMDAVRTQITADQGESSKETMGQIKEELEHLRETLGSTLVKDGSFEHKEEILEALRIGLDGVREANSGSQNSGINQEFLEAIHGELERLRGQIAGNVAARADVEEVLETVRLGLDDLRSHLEKKIDSPERQMQATGEILDALNDGLEGLRTDIGNVNKEPIDMSVSYEILETLKEGLSSIHADIARLKGDKQATVEDDTSFTGNEVVLADDPDKALSRDIPEDGPSAAPESLRRNDLEKVEVMLTQLQIKVEAMDENLQNQAPPVAVPAEPAPGTAMKEDLASVEEMLKDIQATVMVLSERETAPAEGMARKEDTDAIETLLQNTRAKLDEIVLPDPEAAITKEHIDGVEAAVKQTGDVVDALAAKFGEDVASKGDVAVVEVLVQDLKTALDELKAAQPTAPTEEEIADRVTKGDVDLVGALCAEIKEKLDQLPTSDSLPVKADVEQLVGLIHDFRDSHDKLKDSYESDVAVTAQAFDDRKKEAETLVENIAGVKAFLEEVKEEIKAKIQEGSEGVDGIKDSVHGLEENITTNFNVTADVKELMETVNREFERAHGSIDELKTESDARSAAHLEKHDEAKAAVIVEIAAKLDEKFDSMMSKYDDMLVLAESQAQKLDEKTTTQEELLSSTKTMADELKLTIDTLGTTVTTMGTTFTEASEKMSGDSSTVFGRVDEAVVKLDENHTENKAEHQLTRDEISKALAAIDGLQSDVTENHPKFMVTLQEVLALVNQHYESSQKAQEAAQEHSRAAAEESKARAEEIKESFSGLPALLPPPPAAVEPVEQYDDTKLHEKLDTLIGHATDAEKEVAQLERLEEIHKQVMTTAAQVTEFVTTQTRLITEGHESKEKEAEEAALLLERRLVQKDQIEADIHNLNDEKDSLSRASRLNADVSALEMALKIRREELQSMDTKADALERRILNGIMDHSRALLLAKGVPVTESSSTRNADLDRERMPPPSIGAKGLSMALNPRPAVRRNNGGQQVNPAGRRILSLSQISGNTPTGGHAFTGVSGLSNTGLKRSHSVKTNPARKGSWGGAAVRKAADMNKENDILSEEDEPEHEAADELLSDAGTERRHSYATGTGTHDAASSSYESGSYTESVAEGVTPGTDRRTSYGVEGSEYTYGTGSYLTGSEVDRRTSYGTTELGNVAGDEGEDAESESVSDADEQTEHASVEEAGEAARVDSLQEEDAVAGADASLDKGDGEKGHVVYAAPSDSGLGTDLPTAAMGHGSDMDYFRRAAEEESQVSAAP
ncbi:hypothetical protein K490DRAFT_72869 [Saccharata proteae CBS 121410]|uniref:Chromosome segregation ATPase family protein n=1 Tax=Saccharata proteae CBS 121410 TaxID=1314787 RepID=A0A9P4HX53_9PEZI|nr:hypothetical protein K490DRAFT_72869 [Saccharata proteae CBS 121410]